jgi:hypothetical protein
MYAIVFHAHQKLDRVAYRHLRQLLPPGNFFPGVKQVIHFDGRQGPDAVKLKREGGAEQPWHFVDPHDSTDTRLHFQIKEHYDNLVRELSRQDDVRAAFEAAWLAHALVDGLTPAHHYPYEEELERLRGEGRDTRKGIVGRAYVRGDNMRQSVMQSLRLVGPKGLLTTHAMFEAGAYAIIAPLKLAKAAPSADDLVRIRRDGVVAVFKDFAWEVAALHLYNRFYRTGWTQKLSRDVRQELAPRMVRMITLAWYAAAEEALEAKSA